MSEAARPGDLSDLSDLPPSLIQELSTARQAGRRPSPVVGKIYRQLKNGRLATVTNITEHGKVQMRTVGTGRPSTCLAGSFMAMYEATTHTTAR